MLYIFDWDGTLCSSLDQIVRSIHFAAERAGLPQLSTVEASSVIGLGLQEALDALYPDASHRQREMLIHYYREHYLHLDELQPARFFDGVESTLAFLLDQGHKLAVATGKSRKGLDRVLANLGALDYFLATRCADEARSKPDPLMLQHLLQMTGYSASQAVMIGDTDFDLVMAQRAGVPAIGVTYGAHPRERLERCSPQALVGNIEELCGLDLRSLGTSESSAI